MPNAFPLDNTCNIGEYIIHSAEHRTESRLLVGILLCFCNPSVSHPYSDKHRNPVNAEGSIRTTCFLPVFQFSPSSDCRFNFYCRGRIPGLYITGNCLPAGLSVRDSHSFNRHFDLFTQETGLRGVSANFGHPYYIYVVTTSLLYLCL